MACNILMLIVFAIGKKQNHAKPGRAMSQIYDNYCAKVLIFGRNFGSRTYLCVFGIDASRPVRHRPKSQ
jgi:hypothetical protein